MQTPTTAQLRTAIEVLKMLGERVNNTATNAVIELPEAQFDNRHAAHIEAQSIEQISRIKIVSGQLTEWRNLLQQHKRQCVSHHV
ncbi:MAG: hypothetical protein WCS70_02445 [Verrucomicrobiota bacterium]